MAEISDCLDILKIDYINNYNLSNASSFHIGGIADIAVFPKTQEELIQIISVAKEYNTKFEIIGNGSNVLFSDAGYNGIIIITKKIDKVYVDGDYIKASCGTKLYVVSNFAKDNSLSGLEFSHGIPGTIGGAIVMNAGAYGQEMSDSIIFSTAFDTFTNEIIEIDARKHNFSYRHSIYSENENLICLSATFKLTPDNKEKIESRIKNNNESRRQKQPLNLPSCGSYFKRPEGYFAAKLIDDCGLKGLSVGDAQISPKHAGFIVNTGHATAADVLKLAEIAKEKVKNKFGITLESEVKYIC